MEDQRNYLKGILPPPIFFFILILISFFAQWIFPANIILNYWTIRLLISLPILAVSGCLAIDNIANRKEKGDSAAKWKQLTILHYLYTMEEFL